jgi:DNA-binding NarL/FixJ family response regulator
MSITIVIVDDHKILREGLRTLLDQAPGIRVVGEASDGRTAVRLVRELAPDVVVMDIGMPELNGIEATRQIVREMPLIKVIGLTMHTDRRYVLAMFKAGASSFVPKHAAFDELARAITVTAAGKAYISPEIADIMLQEYLTNVPNASPYSCTALTSREREVLQLLAEGHTTKEIAESLCISASTTETYRRQIMEKLNLHNIAQLTRYAIQEGLVPLERYVE